MHVLKTTESKVEEGLKLIPRSAAPLLRARRGPCNTGGSKADLPSSPWKPVLPTPRKLILGRLTRRKPHRGYLRAWIPSSWVAHRDGHGTTPEILRWAQFQAQVRGQGSRRAAKRNSDPSRDSPQRRRARKRAHSSSHSPVTCTRLESLGANRNAPTCWSIWRPREKAAAGPNITSRSTAQSFVLPNPLANPGQGI